MRAVSGNEDPHVGHHWRVAPLLCGPERAACEQPIAWQPLSELKEGSFRGGPGGDALSATYTAPSVCRSEDLQGGLVLHHSTLRLASASAAPGRVLGQKRAPQVASIEACRYLALQPFSQKSHTATVPKVFQIGLCGVVVADLEFFCNSWSVGLLGEPLYWSAILSKRPHSNCCERVLNQASSRVPVLAMNTVFGSHPANEYWLTVR